MACGKLYFNEFYKINGLQLGIHTLNLSCLGNQNSPKKSGVSTYEF